MAASEKLSPLVDYRLGERYYTCDFVTPHTADIVSAPISITDATNDSMVRGIADFIRSGFIYPLDSAGQPAQQLNVSRSRISWRTYLWHKCVDYFWAFPSETMNTRMGICIDTALLCTSMLRAYSLDGVCCLGAVFDTSSDNLLGYHAWTEVTYRGQRYVIETTIHSDSENVSLASDIYEKKLSIYYSKDAWFDEKQYTEIQPSNPYGLWRDFMDALERLRASYLTKKSKKQMNKRIQDAFASLPS